jgi:hypothetical protein
MNQSKQMNTDLSIKATGIPNRINNEIANLFNQSDFVSSERKGTSISLKIKQGKNTYELDLPSDYPFKTPVNIKYNGNCYKKSLFNHSEKVQKILKTQYHMECLCCNTLLCGSNWMPTMNICHLINEIDKIIKIQKEIIIRLLCDEIRVKYLLCTFAEFEKYLFSTF